MRPLAITTLFILCLSIGYIHGHGRMMEPPNRSSLWRAGYSDVTPNYNDDQTNCGGKGIQWETFGGKCGVCGDVYDAPHPQPNENTGTYGQGIIVREYEAGSTVDISIDLTTNHMGSFVFSLCVLDDPSTYESAEDCFQPIMLGDGSPKYVLPNTEEVHEEVYWNTTVALPEGFTCERCVLRWDWTVGNSWGDCDDGTEGFGCGPQETFRSCADIAIV